MKNWKKVLIALGILVLIVVGIFLFGGSKTSEGIPQTTQGGTSQPVKVVPLTNEQKQKVEQTISSSEFFQDIPEDDPISLRFFYFEDNQRVWQDKFYMANGELLTGGQASISLTLHSQYIDELNGNNLCNVIQTANQNKDLGFESPYGEAKLFWKYKSMMKHRDCFGF